MHARRLIQRHFAEELGEAESARLRAHLEQCPRCRAEYDRLAILLRAAAGRTQTRAEVARLRGRLLARVQPQASAAEVPRRQPRLARLAPALSAGLLAAPAALLLLFSPAFRDPDVSWKGGEAPPVVDLQVFAIHEQPGQPAQTRLVAEGGTLYLDELVQFRYLNTDPRQHYLYLLGVDESLQALDYFPRPQAEQSIAIRSTLGMEPVDRSIKLAKRHSAGRLWIYALFSPRPLQRQEVHATLARLRILGVHAELLGRIDWGKDVVPVVRRFKVQEGR